MSLIYESASWRDGSVTNNMRGGRELGTERGLGDITPSSAADEALLGSC